MFGAYLLELGKSIAFVLITVFLAFGGFSGILSLVTWRWKTKFEADIKADFDKKLEAFKAELQAKVQKDIETYKAELQTTADELSQTLSEKITRRSKAFDLRISKQYEFYEKFGPMIQTLIGQSNFVMISIDLIVNTNITFVGEDKKIVIDNEKDNKAKNIEILRPEYKKYLDAVNSLETLFTAYSFYLDTQTCEMCMDCNAHFRKFYQTSYQCINLIESSKEVDGVADNLQEYYDKAVESLKKVGEAIKVRIDVDSRQ